MRSKKGGLIARRKSALQRLEVVYKRFSEAKEDKKPWTTCRRAKLYNHKGRSYDEECKRLQSEITVLKSRLHF